VNPLEPLCKEEDLERVLLSKPSSVVRAALLAWGSRERSPLESAALAFASGSLSLRDGRLDDAKRELEDAAARFATLGEEEASGLSTIEAAVARTRRGRRELAEEALAMVTPLFDSTLPRVRVRALLVQGSALRVMGQAAQAQAAFVVALGASRPFPETRSMVLNSLGTISVTLGAFGAATALCEHAAELCRLRHDVIGEAIAMGQLGAASLGKGDLPSARRYLSRQEWLSREIGDAFGQTRALVWLAEVALDDGRLDDARELASKALGVASSVEPPLTTFMAYANRVLGRAKLRSGDRTGMAQLALSEATFREQRLALGQALAERDLALSSDPVDVAALRRATLTLASLGLVERVLESLEGLPLEGRAETSREVALALAQSMPRRLEPMEAALMVEDPTVLSGTVTARMAARKNLGRLALLASSGPGLLVGLVRVAVADGTLEAAVDHPSSALAVLGELGGLTLVAWAATTELATVTADLARLAPLDGALALAGDAAVLSPGFGGGLAARHRAVPIDALLAGLSQGPASTSSDPTTPRLVAVGPLGPFAPLAP
jgi:tetratricopeptide (TPR) repeat protein